ncbi:MAG: hypothetical protein HDS59_05475 [Barnesiella sp.]|nr:hypothetical protein [Barnesiella sp.]
MKILVTFSLFFAFSISLTLAQSTNTFTVKAYVIDGWTGNAIDKVNAILLSESKTDTIYSKTNSIWTGSRGNMKQNTTINFNVPRNPDTYILKAFAEGYDTVYTTINIDKIGARETSLQIPDLEFYKKSKNLEGATVTATKVKFYMAGDTLVYNADAFKLPEGSMLDALIKQMPGVEMNDNGEIFVNGKKVESLLLNGKDFFKGNKLVMLNNLGAYTVNKVKVYDKMSETSIFAGQDLGDSEYVMDVNLKKEYLNGYMGNIEAGGGTAERYMARLFSMWYTSRSRIALIANINNLNDNRTPGENTAWRASTTPGDTRNKMGGIDYNISGEGNKWELKGDATVDHTRSFNESDTYTTDFHTNRNTFGAAFTNAISRNFNVKSNHTLLLRPGKQLYAVNAHINYSNFNEFTKKLSGTFNSATQQLSETLLEQIFSGELSSFVDNPVYTSLTQSLSSGNTFGAGGRLESTFKIPHTPDLILFRVFGDYRRHHYSEFNRFDINYHTSESHTTDYQFSKNHPDNSWSITANTAYSYAFKPGSHLSFMPQWTHTSATKDSYLYQLDRLEDVGVFGILPDNYLSSLNRDQTYLSTQTDDRISLFVNLIHTFTLSNKRDIDIQVMPDFNYTWRHLDFKQGDIHQNISKNSLYINVPIARIAFNKSQKYQLLLNYNRSNRLVELNRLVDVVNTRDPLNIFTASPNLKNSATNDISLEWRLFGMTKHKWTNYIGLKYSVIENAMVNSYSYNPETGVRTYQMHNVSGNWNANLTERYSKTFGKRNQFSISSGSTVGYGNSTGMLAMTGTDFTKNIVSNLILNQTINFNWSIGKQKIGLKGGIKWRDTHGTDSGFKNFSATDAYYGINGVFSLPCRFGISTDLTFYSRNGYTASSINSTKAVWNGRITYTVKGGKWLIMLDGFDLLHQLDNVTYNVNDQAQTEVYTNVLPRYGLLHIQYKFAIQTKKK